MTPEVPQIDVSDPQGAVDSLQFQAPAEGTPPPFKSRFADIIKQYEGMLAKSQAEDQKATEALNDLMRPDSFQEKYLPKPTARGILQDALNNFGMSYLSSRTGQRFQPIEERRLEHAMQRYQLDTQNKRVDMERSRATMQNLLGQMQQYRLAQNAEESQFQAEQKMKLAQETEDRRKATVEADQNFKRTVLENVTLPATASKIQRDASEIQLKEAMAERIRLAKNPTEFAQLLLTEPFYQTPGIQEKAKAIFEEVMKKSRAGQQSNTWNFRTLTPGFIPGQGQVQPIIDREGRVTNIQTGMLPLNQMDEMRTASAQQDTADGALENLTLAASSGYVNEMSGASKSIGVGKFSLETARKMGLYGQYNSLVEGGLDQYFERLRTGAIAAESGKAFTQGEINEVQRWQPDKTIDQPKDYIIKGFKVALWEKLAKRKMMDNPTGLSPAQRGTGFAGLLNKYVPEIYKQVEKMGPGSTPELRKAWLTAWEERIYSEAQKSPASVVAPPATPAAPKPAARNVNLENSPSAPLLPNPKKLPRWDPATRTFKRD
jgi:hypothetical protein